MCDCLRSCEREGVCVREREGSTVIACAASVCVCVLVSERMRGREGGRERERVPPPIPFLSLSLCLVPPPRHNGTSIPMYTKVNSTTPSRWGGGERCTTVGTTAIWPWVITITYASILGRMNTHVPPILMFSRGTGF